MTEAGRDPTARVSPVGVCRSSPASGGEKAQKLSPRYSAITMSHFLDRQNVAGQKQFSLSINVCIN